MLGAKGPFGIEIDEGEIGIEAGSDAALAVVEPHQAGRIGREEGCDAFERQAALVMALAEQHRQQGLKSGAAGRRGPDAALLG